MKAEIITQTIYEGAIAFVHGIGSQVKRIIVPEANNLVITVHQGNLYIWDNFQKDDCQTIKEIDIPDELVKKAAEFIKAKNDLLPQLKKLIEENS